MPRTLATFLITLGVAAPALLDANIEVDGKKLRPHQQTFTVDGTRVTIDVDRALVTTGDKVTATLVAYSDTPKPVVLDLRLVQTDLQPGERVEPPSHQIDREKVTLQAKPEGGKTVVALVLGKRRNWLGQLDLFQVMVAPHGTPAPTKADFDGGGDNWAAIVEAGKAASVNVLGWGGNSIAMKTSVEGSIVAGQPFVVAVTVKNTTGEVLPRPAAVDIVTGETLSARTTADDPAVKIEPLDDRTAADIVVKRGVEVVRRFRITPLANQKDLTLAVSATAYGADIGPIIGAAYDAVTFHATDADAKVAVR
jgi:hypothetical protein